LAEAEIDLVTWEERGRALEQRWTSQTGWESGLESPCWHERELKETFARHNAGEEQPLDWDEAKRRLRKR